MNRAIVFDPRATPPETRIVDFPVRSLEPDEIRIEVRAVPISAYWLSMESVPFVPSWIVAGTVVEVGTAVARPLLGRRVAAMHRTGGLAESVVVPFLAAISLPDELSFVDAVSLAAGTKATLVVDAVMERMAPSEHPPRIAVVHDGTHFGSLVAGLLHAAGSRTIGLSAPPSTAEHQRAIGFHEVIELDTDDADGTAAGLLRLTADATVDAVIDHLGTATLEAVSDVLRPGGVLLRCDRERSPSPPLSDPVANRLAELRAQVVEFAGIEAAAAVVDEIPNRVARVMRAIIDGTIVLPATTLPFDEAERIPELLARGDLAGALVITL